jgi:hypothetical protein
MKTFFQTVRPLIWVFSVLFLLPACTGTPHVQHDFPGFKDRVETVQKDNLTVSVAALGRKESLEVFSAPLNDIGIQPIWLKIENRTAVTQWIFPIGVDDNYFPPYETARRARLISQLDEAELYEKLDLAAIPYVLRPGETASGFIYAHTDEGMKALNIRLHGETDEHNFHFVVPVPGLPGKYFDPNPRDIYQSGRVSLNEAELRDWLSKLPCCARNEDKVSGDPLNLVFVGELDTLREALISNHWDVTAPLSSASIRRMVSAFIFGSRYRYAPISPLFLFDREQDIAFQKARAVIDERNHMRLWLAPVLLEGKSVWIGQISRDVGVKFSGRFWPPTTHIIDPDMDDARFYIVQQLLDTGYASRFGFVEGFEAATPSTPRFNAENDQYFTDGHLAVFFLVKDPVTPSKIKLLEWDTPKGLFAR